ncbi:MAG TPA: hypothetical protein VKZ18_06525 [Polyangia bacterium]|nr:hypothetical protein [Polyangia bacterium]
MAESGVATAVVLGAVALAFPRSHLGWGLLRPHPVWLVVLAMGARYGARGLVASVPIAWGGLALLGAPWRSASSLALAGLSAPPELGALAAAIVVGWVASVHERRAEDLEERCQTLTARADHDATSLAELRRAALALRARNDRLDMALTFLRDVARRIDGGDLNAASEAALALVVARLGARAGAALARIGDGTLTLVATTGVWDAAATPGSTDEAVAEALRTGQPVRAVDLPGSGPEDSDLAAPIVVGAETVGVLAVRGVARVGAAALRDLTVVAEWLGTAFARARARRQGERGDRSTGSVVNV